jgi:hypothetical protein
MMAPQAAKPIAATRFANLMCWMGSMQSGALLRRSNDSLVYPRNKNGMPWLPWRRPGDKRSALQLLDCPKAKQSSAIALTRSARWNLISASKREQLYRRSSKIQFALCGVAAWRRVLPRRGTNLAQGGGLAELWVRCFCAICPVGAGDSRRGFCIGL